VLFVGLHLYFGVFYRQNREEGVKITQTLWCLAESRHLRFQEYNRKRRVKGENNEIYVGEKR